MYGKNALVKQDLTCPNKLRVTEIFHTIQGEGPNTGQRAVFVRLTGCNLRCYFCDTDFETMRETLSPASILARVRRFQHGGLVVITGGEPMLQNITPLCAKLIDDGYHVQVETAGTVWVPELSEAVELVCSPKTGNVHVEIERRCRSWKYIIAADAVCSWDGLPTMSTQRETTELRLYRPEHGTIYLQPMDSGKTEANHANMATAVAACLKHGYRLSIQTHKIAGVP